MTSPRTTEAANLAILSAGNFTVLERVPLFIEGDAPRPVDGTDGYGCRGALAGALSLSLRAEPGRRRAWLEIGSPDYTATYTVTVAGNAVDYDASTASPTPTTLQELCDGIADAINADGTVSLDVTADTVAGWRDDGDDTDIVVRLVGVDDEDWTLAFADDASADTQAYAEPSTALASVYGRPGPAILSSRQPARMDSAGQLPGWGPLATPNGVALGLSVGSSDDPGDGLLVSLGVQGVDTVYPRVYDMEGPSGETGVTYVAMPVLYVGRIPGST